MFCSGCGQAIQEGAQNCAACGRPVTVAAPIASPLSSIPGFEWQLRNYATRIKTLGVFWAVYAVVAFLTGMAGIGFLHAFMGNHLSWFPHEDFGDNPMMEEWMRVIMHIAWVAVVLRSATAAFAAWGLLTRAPWGRIVAIIAAFLGILKFPFGMGMGIWTLVTTLGYRNSVLYEHLSAAPDKAGL
jgi:hypothetical protein